MPECIGFGEYEDRCQHAPVDSPLWCPRCEKLRRAHITEQMAGITKWFERAADTEPEEER